MTIELLFIAKNKKMILYNKYCDSVAAIPNIGETIRIEEKEYQILKRKFTYFEGDEYEADLRISFLCEEEKTNPYDSLHTPVSR